LEELGTEYLDIVLLHGLTNPEWNAHYRGAMDALRSLKERGVIRAIGASCHSLGALSTTAEDPWVDVMLTRLNYAGSNMDAAPEEVIPIVRRAKENGKAIIAMKVLGRGSLGADPAKAIRWVMDLGIVDALTIGPETLDQIKENARIIDQCEKVGAGS
jgi:predicted aldo/keto reductase-like oxidoreductase